MLNSIFTIIILIVILRIEQMPNNVSRMILDLLIDYSRLY